MVWIVVGHPEAGEFETEGQAHVAAWKIADRAGQLHRPAVHEFPGSPEPVELATLTAAFGVPVETVPSLDTLREQMAKLREMTAASEIRMGDFRRAMKNIEAASRGTHGRS